MLPMEREEIFAAAPKTAGLNFWKLKLGAFHRKPSAGLTRLQSECEFSIKILMLHNH